MCVCVWECCGSGLLEEEERIIYLSVLESFKPPRVSAFSLAFACLVVLLCAREGVVGAVSWLSTAGCEFR